MRRKNLWLRLSSCTMAALIATTFSINNSFLFSENHAGLFIIYVNHNCSYFRMKLPQG